MSKHSPGVRDAGLRCLLTPALRGKDGSCPQSAGVPKPPAPGWWVCAALGPCTTEGGEVFSPQQIVAAGWGCARLGQLHAQSRPPRLLKLAPTGPSVPLRLPSLGFASSKPSPLCYLRAVLLASPSPRVHPAPAKAGSGAQPCSSELMAPPPPTTLCFPLPKGITSPQNAMFSLPAPQEPSWGHSKLLHQL